MPHGAPLPSEAVTRLACSLVNALTTARCRFGLRTGVRAFGTLVAFARTGEIFKSCVVGRGVGE